MMSSAEMKARGYDPDTISAQLRREKAVDEAAPLVVEIERAFAGVPRPLITVSVAYGLDDEWTLSDERGRELRALDPEEDWMKLDHDTIHGFVRSHIFMDAAAWHFYLPAYMRDCLRGSPDNWDVFVNAGCADEKFLSCFNGIQRGLVRRFLEFCYYQKLV